MSADAKFSELSEEEAAALWYVPSTPPAPAEPKPIRKPSPSVASQPSADAKTLPAFWKLKICSLSQLSQVQAETWLKFLDQKPQGLHQRKERQTPC